VDAQRSQGWIRAALLAGAIYLLIGRVFALPFDLLREWRPAAWVLSGATYVTHIWYEHFRLRSPHRLTALHVAVSVAIAAFGLAVAAMIYSVSPVANTGPVWFLAFVLWPAVTGVPAFLIALLIAALLSHFARST
jgi:hypothetical protein